MLPSCICFLIQQKCSQLQSNRCFLSQHFWKVNLKLVYYSESYLVLCCYKQSNWHNWNMDKSNLFVPSPKWSAQSIKKWMLKYWSADTWKLFPRQRSCPHSNQSEQFKAFLFPVFRDWQEKESGIISRFEFITKKTWLLNIFIGNMN